MPNRQYGRSQISSGSRNLARTVPVSRFPSGFRSPAGGGGAFRSVSRSGYKEPEVRRWPHPVEDGTPVPASGPEPALHYIRCALSYQNQLLADIKVLLEQLALDAGASPAESQEKG